jgi:hypothetical protein
VGARSKAWVSGHSLAGIVGSNPAGGMDVCLLCVVRCLCDGLITRPQEFYRVWCVWVWSRSLDSEGALAQAHEGLGAKEKKII